MQTKVRKGLGEKNGCTQKESREESREEKSCTTNTEERKLPTPTPFLFTVNQVNDLGLCWSDKGERPGRFRRVFGAGFVRLNKKNLIKFLKEVGDDQIQPFLERLYPQLDDDLFFEQVETRVLWEFNKELKALVTKNSKYSPLRFWNGLSELNSYLNEVGFYDCPTCGQEIVVLGNTNNRALMREKKKQKEAIRNKLIKVWADTFMTNYHKAVKNLGLK